MTAQRLEKLEGKAGARNHEGTGGAVGEYHASPGDKRFSGKNNLRCRSASAIHVCVDFAGARLSDVLTEERPIVAWTVAPPAFGPQRRRVTPFSS